MFQKIPLSLMEVWGSFGYIVGLLLMLFAYGGFTFRTADRWALGREWQSWDGKSLLSIGITFVLIFVTGYIGSHFVLVPGAQTFESLKDLSVFLCIVLFGYPALLAVPFAYGLTDLYEGVPPDFLLDWITGYFINPACFWIAYQFIGKNPDFRLKKTWGLYLLFVLIFMSIEPQLWGFLCADKFTTQISYNTITPAIFYTTSITWLMGPFAMLVAYPLAKKYGLFWAEIPSHVKQRILGFKEWIWESGPEKFKSISDPKDGFPIRLFLLIPFVSVAMIIIGMTAYFAFKSSEVASKKLAENFHHEITENLQLKLDSYLSQKKIPHDEIDLENILNSLTLRKHGKAIILNRSGEIVAASVSLRKGMITKGVLDGLKNSPQGIAGLRKAVKYRFDIVTARPLAREPWLIQATPYQNGWILVTVIPENYFMQGVLEGNSKSAMVFAFALVVVLLLTALLASMVISPIQKICHATEALCEGDYSQRVSSSRLREINTLAHAFNKMAAKIQESMENIISEVEAKNSSEGRLQLATRTANIGIWQWNVENDELIWNDQMYEHYGLDPLVDKINYDTWEKHLAPQDQKRVLAEVLSAMKGEKEFDSEFRIIRSNGTFRHIKAHSKAIRNEMGRTICMIGVNYDITDKKRSEIEIEHYRNNLEELVQERTAELSRKTQEVKELTEKQARSDIYEKFAQIFLSMRDNANSPLQVQTLVIAMLKKYYPERTDIIQHLESSVASLSNMNKILSRLESRITMNSKTLMSEQEILAFLDEFEKNT